MASLWFADSIGSLCFGEKGLVLFLVTMLEYKKPQHAATEMKMFPVIDKDRLFWKHVCTYITQKCHFSERVSQLMENTWHHCGQTVQARSLNQVSKTWLGCALCVCDQRYYNWDHGIFPRKHLQCLQQYQWNNRLLMTWIISPKHSILWGFLSVQLKSPLYNFCPSQQHKFILRIRYYISIW